MEMGGCVVSAFAMMFLAASAGRVAAQVDEAEPEKTERVANILAALRAPRRPQDC